MPTKWNPNDKGTGIFLFNNNLTALLTSGSNPCVRSTTAKTIGKWYFEVRTEWRGSGSRMAGIMLPTASVSAFMGLDDKGYSLLHVSGTGWNVIFNSVTTTYGSIIPDFNPHLLGVCVDLDNNFLYATLDGVNVIGDPVALTGGHAIFAGTWYAALGGSNLSLTTNFGATGFSFGPPAPFSAWDTSPFINNSFDTHTVSIVSVSQPVGS